MNEVILTTNLTKSYKDFHAVNQVSLSVKKGEIYGFIGLNGAGKTTTIRMLLGMIRPTSGSCFLNGRKVSANDIKIWEKVGYMVETPYSYPELTVKENLEITRHLRGIHNEKAVEQIIDQLKLTPYTHRKAIHLSLGNAQRLGIAKALLHQPDILILDEPTNGLDPAGILEIRELLKDLAFNRGTTVFISSHILGELTRIATKIGMIHEGKLVQEVKTNEWARLLNKRLIIETRDNERASEDLISAGFSVNHSTHSLELRDENAIRNPDKIAELLVNSGFPPTKLLVDEENLESYFLRTIGVKKGELAR